MFDTSLTPYTVTFVFAVHISVKYMCWFSNLSAILLLYYNLYDITVVLYYVTDYISCYNITSSNGIVGNYIS